MTIFAIALASFALGFSLSNALEVYMQRRQRRGDKTIDQVARKVSANARKDGAKA